MNQQDTKFTLLVRALERQDSKKVLVRQEKREECTRKAREQFKNLTRPDATSRKFSHYQQKFIAARARLIIKELPSNHAFLAELAKESTLFGKVTFVLCVVVFILGFFSYEIPSEKRIDLIAFPLLELITWNVFVYLLLLWSWYRSPKAVQKTNIEARYQKGFLRRWLPEPRTRKPRPSTKGLGSLLANWYFKGLKTRIPSDPSELGGDDADRERDMAAIRIANGFAADWTRRRWSVTLEQTSLLFHYCALFLALGFAFGLVWSGIHNKYSVEWNTTFPFVTPERVHGALALIFAPVTPILSIFGISLPTAETFGELRDASADAANWIWFYFSAALLYIGAGRLLLIVLGHRQKKWLSKKIHTPSPSDQYYWSLFQTKDSSKKTCFVIFYADDKAFKPVDGTQLSSSVKELVSRKYGVGVHPEILPPISPGSESVVRDQLARLDSGDCIAIVVDASLQPDSRFEQLLKEIGWWPKREERSRPLLIAAAVGPTAQKKTWDWLKKKLSRSPASVKAWKNKAEYFGLDFCSLEANS